MYDMCIRTCACMYVLRMRHYSSHEHVHAYGLVILLKINTCTFALNKILKKSCLTRKLSSISNVKPLNTYYKQNICNVSIFDKIIYTYFYVMIETLCNKYACNYPN